MAISGSAVAQSDGLCIRGRLTLVNFSSVVVSVLISLVSGGGAGFQGFFFFFSNSTKNFLLGELVKAPTVDGSRCAEKVGQNFLERK